MAILIKENDKFKIVRSFIKKENGLELVNGIFFDGLPDSTVTIRWFKDKKYNVLCNIKNVSTEELNENNFNSFVKNNAPYFNMRQNYVFSQDLKDKKMDYWWNAVDEIIEKFDGSEETYNEIVVKLEEKMIETWKILAFDSEYRYAGTYPIEGIRGQMNVKIYVAYSLDDTMYITATKSLFRGTNGWEVEV